MIAQRKIIQRLARRHRNVRVVKRM